VAVAFEAKGGLSDLKSTATAAVVKALLGSSSREVLPYTRKTLEGPLTSVTPLVQVGLLGTAYTTHGRSIVFAVFTPGHIQLP
jgi:hypothetical protein